MIIKNNKKNSNNWPLIFLVFILGVMLSAIIFLSFDNYRQGQEINNLNNEIEKLKADDLAIAQVINNLLNNLQARNIIIPPLQNDK